MVTLLSYSVLKLGANSLVPAELMPYNIMMMVNSFKAGYTADVLYNYEDWFQRECKNQKNNSLMPWEAGVKKVNCKFHKMSFPSDENTIIVSFSWITQEWSSHLYFAVCCLQNIMLCESQYFNLDAFKSQENLY